MCFEHYNMSDTWTSVLGTFNVFFTVVFTMEMLLKIFALRHHYFTLGWNLFDIVVVVLSLMWLFLEDMMKKYLLVSPALLRAVGLLCYQYFSTDISKSFISWNLFYITIGTALKLTWLFISGSICKIAPNVASHWRF